MPAKQVLNSIISETTKIILGRKRKLVANFDVGPAFKQNKQRSKPGRKVPNEVPSSIEYWIEEEEEKKTRQIELEVEKKNVGNY